MALELSAGRVLLRAGIRGIAAAIPGGALVGALFEEVAMPFCDAAWDWLRARPASEQQQAIDALAQLPAADARAIAETELNVVGLPPATRAELVNYLSVVPMSARRAISRTNDAGKPSVLLSQLPRSGTSLMSFLPARPPRFQPGHKVPAHDLELELLLGQGGFGEVWKARHLRRKAEPPRALKFCLEPAMQVSLERELELLDRIELEGRHEGIVQLLGTALSAEPPFLTYEYIDGGDLVAWLASFEGKPPPVQEVLRVLRMTAEALAFAHGRGIVHLDLKPANLLVTRKGRVKIGDFGIGRLVSEAEARQSQSQLMTSLTALHGACTPLYADRAQQRGERVDARADVYALGVIGYQLLMGDVTLGLPSYWRDELEERDVPAGLLSVLAACVSLPSRRLTDARAVLSELGKTGLETDLGRRPAAQEQRTEDLERVKTPAAQEQRTKDPAPAKSREAPARRKTRRPAGQVCTDCGRAFRTEKGLSRHAAVHGRAVAEAPPAGRAPALEISVLAGADLRGKIRTDRAQLLYTAYHVQSADVIAYMARATGATPEQAAGAVDGFWGYVANVRDHYRRAKEPYLVIPRFGTFRLQPLRYRPRLWTLHFRSRPVEPGSAGARQGRAAGAGAQTRQGPAPARGPQAGPLPERRASWYQRLTRFLGSESSDAASGPPASPRPGVLPGAEAGRPPAGPGPLDPARGRASSLGWTSSVLAGKVQPAELSVKRRIAWHISASAHLPLPLAARLLDALLGAMGIVFERQAPVLHWVRRGVMFPASAWKGREPITGRVLSRPRGRYYKFRCAPDFSRRLLI